MNIINTAHSLASALGTLPTDTNIEVKSWKDALLQSTPLELVVHDAPATIALSTGGASIPLQLTGSLALRLDLDAAFRLELDPIWKTTPLAPELLALVTDGFLPATVLDDQQLYLRLLIEASAGANASAAYPVGAFTLGINAGGQAACRYQRFLLQPVTTPAPDLLLNLFSTLRSPFHVPPLGAPVLAPHEVLSFAFNGSLKFGVSVAAGYSISGAEKIDVPDFAPVLRYQFKAALAATLGVTATGAFSYTLAPSLANPGSVRLRLAKENSVGADCGLGVKLDFDGGIDGLPETPEALLATLFGGDPAGVLEIIKTFVAQPSLAATLQALAAKYTPELVGHLTAAISKSDLQALLAHSAAANARALELIASSGLAPATLSAQLTAIAKAEKLDDLFAAFESSPAPGSPAAFLLENFGDEVMDFFERQDRFADFQAIASELAAILNGSGNLLLTLADRLPTPADIKAILAAILAPAATPQTLLAALNPFLTAKAQALLGPLWTNLAANPAAAAAWKDLHDAARQLVAFRDRLASALKSARKLQAQATLGLAFGTSLESAALIDADIDVSTADGRDLLQSALSGDFDPLLAAADQGGSLVRLRAGRLTRARRANSRLSVSALGWSLTRDFLITQAATAEISKGAHGLLYLISTETAFTTKNTTKRDDEIEQLSTRFHLLAATQAVEADRVGRHFLSASLRHLGTGYALNRSDSATTWDELADYLRFAEQLNLFRGATRADYLRTLKSSHPRTTPGTTTLEYIVKYRPDALSSALNSFGIAELRTIARDAVRRVFSHNQLQKDDTAANRALIADYLASERIERRQSGTRRGGNNTHGPDYVYLHFPATTGRPSLSYANTDASKLLRLDEEEKAFLDALLTLADVVDEPRIDPKRLDKAAWDFAAVAKGKPLLGSRLWRENAFFLAVDAILAASADRDDSPVRESGLLLTLTPAVAEGAQPVTHRYFLSA